MTIYKDRQRFYQAYKRNIPWAIIDEASDELPVASDYGVPRVMASKADWPDRLLQTLSSQ
jgi:hypothetical protein